MFKMKSNNTEPNKSESSLSFHHLNNVYSKVNNQATSVELVSPYMYKQIGIYGHRIHSFRNSDLKTPELAENHELNKNYFNNIFSKNLNKFNHLITNSSINLTKRESNEINSTPTENVVQIRPASLNELNDRLRRIYSDSFDNSLMNKSTNSSRMTAQTKILYNLSKIHMQNKLQLLSRIGSRNSRLY